MSGLLLIAGPSVALGGSPFTRATAIPRPALIALSKDSSIHLLVRQKGFPGPWYPDCSASKISATELVSASHCFRPYLFPMADSEEYAQNVVELTDMEFSAADPRNIARPLLPVTGIAIDRKNDVALLNVNPDAANVSTAARAEWKQVRALPLPLADRPPPANTPVVVTSFPIGRDGKAHEITWVARFANRRSDGISTPNPGAAYEDNVVGGRDAVRACRPGASGSRLIFADGTTSGGLWSAVPSSIVPQGAIPAAVDAKGDYSVVCSFSVLNDRILSGLRAGLSGRSHLARRRPVSWHLLQSDIDPAGANPALVKGGPLVFEGTFAPPPLTAVTHTWWQPERWSVSVISAASQLKAAEKFGGPALTRAIENASSSVNFGNQKLLLIQIDAVGGCCDFGIEKTAAEGNNVTITVAPTVLGGCLDPSSGPPSCQSAPDKITVFRLVRVGAQAVPDGTTFTVGYSQQPLPSDHAVPSQPTTGPSRAISFSSAGTGEDGGIGDLPTLTGTVPEFAGLATQLDNDPPWRSWGVVRDRITVFSRSEELERLLPYLGSPWTLTAIEAASRDIDFTKQRMILIQLATSNGCCNFTATTLSVSATGAAVELHPIVPRCVSHDGTPCSIAIWDGPDSYYLIITVDRNAFPIPSTFTVATSQIPALQP